MRQFHDGDHVSGSMKFEDVNWAGTWVVCRLNISCAGVSPTRRLLHRRVDESLRRQNATSKKCRLGPNFPISGLIIDRMCFKFMEIID